MLNSNKIAGLTEVRNRCHTPKSRPWDCVIYSTVFTEKNCRTLRPVRLWTLLPDTTILSINLDSSTQPLRLDSEECQSGRLPEGDFWYETLHPVVEGPSERDGLAGLVHCWHSPLVDAQAVPAVDRHDTAQPIHSRVSAVKSLWREGTKQSGSVLSAVWYHSVTEVIQHKNKHMKNESLVRSEVWLHTPLLYLFFFFETRPYYVTGGTRTCYVDLKLTEICVSLPLEYWN